MLFRRVPTLAAIWDGDGLTARNYISRTESVVSPEDVAILDALHDWRSVGDLRAQMRSVSARQLRRRLSALVTKKLVESSDQPASRAAQGLVAWTDWTPSAAFFHFDTKDTRFVDMETAKRLLALQQATEPQPSPVKALRGPIVRLPAYRRRGAFPELLLARRSWRRFAVRSIPLAQLATLLGLTWGTQRWMHLEGDVRLALKTSPSGGACHPIEVYVAARRVGGLSPGLYHYNHDAHALSKVRSGCDSRWLTRALAGQDWFGRSAATMFMTAVFPRAQWKYRSPRAYRSVLMEAGHLCQTFCLSATWLGLAPFCTAALADTFIERSLRIDGVTESVLYAAGIGARPPGETWAPWPRTLTVPHTTAPLRQRKRGA
jgi:SagB-type dehydrogenase family enzyme